MSGNRSLLQSSRQSPFHNTRRQLVQREDTLNLSPIPNDSLYRTLNDTSLRRALDDSSMIVPRSIGEGLDEVFFETLQSGHQSDILDTLSRLAQACLDSLELAEPWNRYNAQNYWLAEEANTWKLLHCLYADSIQETPQVLDDLRIEISQQTLVGTFFQCDKEVRLHQLLVDWLENTAAYQEEATRTSAPIIGDNAHWSNTLHQMLIGNTLFNKEKSRSMVTCMDPDAPRRQKRTIHSDDQQDDNDLCKRIFTELRCGKLDDAISLCVGAGQAWRAAVLQGWRLLHYLSRDDPTAPLQISGNPSRDLWKWACLSIANNTSENLYYRATLGILCGHLPSTIPACHGNWKDLLWAHLRVQIETRVNTFLHENHSTIYANNTPDEVMELLESDFHIEQLSLEQVFSAINALMNGKKESQYQRCQKHIMLGHITTIMEESLDWLEIGEENLVRFLAHLVIVLRQMGKDPNHDIGDKILEKYVSQLIERLVEGSVDCPNLIAFYTSTVPVTRQIQLYAHLLDRVDKSECRQDVVKAGLLAGVDVAAAARVAIKKAISNIHEGYGNIDMVFTQTGVTENDKVLVGKVVSSLEWLALLPDQLVEALWLSNAMIRTFIFIGNTEAASSVIKKTDQLFSPFIKKLPINCSELREYLCLKAYLEALNEFATWYRFLMGGQPKGLESLPEDATFSDKVLHEEKCAQLEQQKIRWQNTVDNLSHHTKKLLYDAMLFSGGWLEDDDNGVCSENFSEDEQQGRYQQLETLRRLCIPEMAILILKILQNGNDIESHKEVVNLSDVLADENRRLYKSFSKEKLVEVLERIKESSLLLMEKGRDMFGYEENDDD